MRSPMGRILSSLGVLVLVAACGGGASASAGADGAGDASPDTGGVASAEAPVESTAGGAASADASAPAEAPPDGGGPAADACGLVTVAELESAFGVSGVTQQLIEGFPATCDVQLAGAPFMAIVLVDDPASSGPIYDAWAADAAATTIDGIGDRAVYAPSNAILVIQRGDKVISLALFDDGSRTEEERIEMLRRAGEVAAGRM